MVKCETVSFSTNYGTNCPIINIIIYVIEAHFIVFCVEEGTTVLYVTTIIIMCRVELWLRGYRTLE